MAISKAQIFVLAVTAAAIGLGAAASPSDAPPPWPDSFLGRVEALAVLQTLNADLLSHDSATLTLDRWCVAHDLSAGAMVVAERVRGEDKPATPDVRRTLDAAPDEPIRYRRVRLSCGGHVLSEADNWYRPERLTPQMNQALDTSDVPFGRAIQALNFHRRTLSAQVLWSPLPEGWEMQPQPSRATSRSLAIPDRVLQHRAVLVLPDATPISEVVETYTGGVLAFARAPPKPG
jgi:hypothetical protein